MISNIRINKYKYEQVADNLGKIRSKLLIPGIFLIAGGTWMIFLSSYIYTQTNGETTYTLFISGVVTLCIIPWLKVGRPNYVGARFSSNIPKELSAFEIQLHSTIAHFRNRLIMTLPLIPYFGWLIYLLISSKPTAVLHLSSSLPTLLCTLFGLLGAIIGTEYLQVWWSIGKEIKMHKE